MLDFGTSILAFIVAIGVLVAVHEFGHYWVARRLGFKVLRFSIGFGRPLLRWRGSAPDNVEYWISSLPLGGYVKMLDEREGPVASADSHRAFNRRPIPHRIAVLLAGPAFNFLFAIGAYWLMYTAGVPALRPVIGAVTEGSVAAVAGLAAEDEIETVGGRPTPTLESATLAMFDELLADGVLDLTVRTPAGELKQVDLDVRGRVGELTEQQALFTGLGFRPGPAVPPDISGVVEGSPAEAAGIEVGDRVLSIDGVRTDAWDDLVAYVSERPGETIDITVLRAGERLTLPVTVAVQEEAGATVGRIGAAHAPRISAETLERISTREHYGVFGSVPRAVAKTWEMSALTVNMLGHMVVGQVSIKNLSGPIAIGEFAGETARAGLTTFLNFLAVMSISLGILNLLPVPVLDGGQVVYQIAEGVKGSPISERALVLGQQFGLLAVAVLMSFVIYNDLSRLLGG